MPISCRVRNDVPVVGGLPITLDGPRLALALIEQASLSRFDVGGLPYERLANFVVWAKLMAVAGREGDLDALEVERRFLAGENESAVADSFLPQRVGDTKPDCGA